MRTIAILLFFTGVVFITIGYTKMTHKCPPPQVEYRYIPRSIYDDQIYNQSITKKFKGMFSEDSKN